MYSDGLRPLLQDVVLLEKHGVYEEKLGSIVSKELFCILQQIIWLLILWQDSKKVLSLRRFVAFAWLHGRKYKITKVWSLLLENKTGP